MVILWLTHRYYVMAQIGGADVSQHTVYTALHLQTAKGQKSLHAIPTIKVPKSSTNEINNLVWQCFLTLYTQPNGKRHMTAQLLNDLAMQIIQFLCQQVTHKIKDLRQQ